MTFHLTKKKKKSQEKRTISTFNKTQRQLEKHFESFFPFWDLKQPGPRGFCRQVVPGAVLLGAPDRALLALLRIFQDSSTQRTGFKLPLKRVTMKTPKRKPGLENTGPWLQIKPYHSKPSSGLWEKPLSRLSSKPTLGTATPSLASLMLLKLTQKAKAQ